MVQHRLVERDQQILTMRRAGTKLAVIACSLDIPYSTVEGVLRRYRLAEGINHVCPTCGGNTYTRPVRGVGHG